MKIIKNGIVFSDDIERILEGYNALNYPYEQTPSKGTIESVRRDFQQQVCTFFQDVTIIPEDDMMELNNLIEGRYPHYYAR